MPNPPPALAPPPGSGEPPPSLGATVRRILVGPPRDLHDRGLFRRISLVALLAWVGLGADGLSSSAYGPEEAFRTLGQHTYLALGLAALMAVTVLVISTAYSRIIEQFPHGGGGYVVATKLLGARAGVASGSALLVDYVLTITVSVAASGDALFSFLPSGWLAWKLAVEVAAIAFLILLNLRGVRESVLTLTPIFLLFFATHILLIGGGVLAKAPDLPATLGAARTGFSDGLATLGGSGLLLLFVYAFSLGGGTYTGIEAVSNGVSIMREPQVQTAKKTMRYMGLSLAAMASGLLFCYLLWNVAPVSGQTMNAVLARRFAEAVPVGGSTFVILALVSEGALLLTAAQTGFVDGPRVLANMAKDYWVPRRFTALSDRLTTQNGILLMGLASLAALLYTQGDVRFIVVMYSINVFLTFSLSMLGMLRRSWRRRNRAPRQGHPVALFTAGLVLTSTILGITTFEKFSQGGWITLAATGGFMALCFLIRRHYNLVHARLDRLYERLSEPSPPATAATSASPDPSQPVAAVLVPRYGGLGLHTFLSISQNFQDHFRGVVFILVGVIDSREFKGEGTLEALKVHVEEDLRKYVDFARRRGIPAASRSAIGTDIVDTTQKLCMEVAAEYPKVTFFAGKVLFRREKWYHGILHNQTGLAIQKRLQWSGKVVVVVPAQIS